MTVNNATICFGQKQQPVVKVASCFITWQKSFKTCAGHMLEGDADDIDRCRTAIYKQTPIDR